MSLLVLCGFAVERLDAGREFKATRVGRFERNLHVFHRMLEGDRLLTHHHFAAAIEGVVLQHYIAKEAYRLVNRLIHQNADGVLEGVAAEADILNVEVRSGESLDVQLHYYADLMIVPGKILPQPAQASFLFGGGGYTSGISIVTQPITIEILEPEVEPNVDYISFRASVKEAFDSDPARMNPTMTITPPQKGEFKTYTNATGTKTIDGILFNVDWEFTKDKAKDGKYTVTLDLSYDGNLTFSNTTSFELDVPEKSVTDISQTPKEPFIAIGIIVVVCLLLFIAHKKGLFKRKKSKAKKGPKVKAKGMPKGKPTSKPKKKERIVEAEEIDD